MKSVVRELMARVAGRYGYELRREPSTAAFLHARGVDLVVDVGANAGQYAGALRRAGYRGRIHSFEPVAAVFATLAGRAARDPAWQATRSAVGATTGEATINVAADTVYSSIRTASAFGGVRDRNMLPVRTERVSVTTLDNVIAPGSASAFFLKIDTQGFEREVLDGARALLPACVGLQLELPIEHLYEGVWSFDEAIACATGLGFVPAQFRTVCTSNTFPAAAVEVDCIFRRAA